jgi:Tol biopolymer transport system component
VAVAADGAAPRLGPDFLVYVSARGGRQGVWTLARGTARELWSGARGSAVGAPAVSRDGRRIVFSVASGAVNQLYLMNRDGSQPRMLAEGLTLRGSPAWAPDGRSVIVAVVREGEPHVTRIPLADEAPQQLLAEYSLDPVWSPDGRFLIYSGADVGTTFPVRAAAADGRPYPMPGLMLTRGARRMVFLNNPRSLVVLGGGIGHKDLRLFDLSSGSERVLVALPQDFIVSDFDVSADGSEIVFERVQESSELAMIERRL